LFFGRITASTRNNKLPTLKENKSNKRTPPQSKVNNQNCNGRKLRTKEEKIKPANLKIGTENTQKKTKNVLKKSSKSAKI
jgi:hypothetical protein